MAETSLVYINGTALPSPTKYRPLLSDLDSSDTSRSESGILFRNRVRSGVRKVELSWTLRSAQTAALLSLVEPAQFTARFFDPADNAYHTATMYAGDKSVELRMLQDLQDPAEALWDVSFNLIEY